MTDLVALLTDIYGLGWLFSMEHWLVNLLIGIHIVLLIAAAAFASVRMGVTPLWTLLLVVPFLQIVGLAGIAFVRWPRVDGPRRVQTEHPPG